MTGEASPARAASDSPEESSAEPDVDESVSASEFALPQETAARVPAVTSTVLFLHLESPDRDINLPMVDEVARGLTGIIDTTLVEYEGTRAVLKVVAEGEEDEARQIVDELVGALAEANEVGQVAVTAGRGAERDQ